MFECAKVGHQTTELGWLTILMYSVHVFTSELSHFFQRFRNCACRRYGALIITAQSSHS